MRYLKRRNTREENGDFRAGGPPISQGADSPSKTLAGIEVGALESFLENGAALMTAFATPLSLSPQSSASKTPGVIREDPLMEKQSAQSGATGQTGLNSLEDGSETAATNRFGTQSERGAIPQSSSFLASQTESLVRGGFGIPTEPKEPASDGGVHKPAESDGADDALEELLRQMEKNSKLERPAQAASGSELARAGSHLGGLVQEETTVLSFKAVRASAVGRSVSPSTASSASEAGSAEPPNYLSELDVGTSESSPIRSQEILRAFGSGSFASGWGLETQGAMPESEMQPEPEFAETIQGSASRSEGGRTEGDRKGPVLAVEESRSEEIPRSSPLKRPRSPSPERRVEGIRASELLLAAEVNREKLPAVVFPEISLTKGQDTEEKSVRELNSETNSESPVPQLVQSSSEGSLTESLKGEADADGLLGVSVIKEAPPPFVFGETAATGKSNGNAEEPGLDLTLAAWKTDETLKKDPEDPLSFPVDQGEDGAADAEEGLNATAAENESVSAGGGSSAEAGVAQQTSVPAPEVVEKVYNSPVERAKSDVKVVSQSGEPKEEQEACQNPGGEELEKSGPEADQNPDVLAEKEALALAMSEGLKPAEKSATPAPSFSTIKVEKEQLKEPARAEREGDEIGVEKTSWERASEAKAGDDAVDGKIPFAAAQLGNKEKEPDANEESGAQKESVNEKRLSRDVRAEEAIAAAEEAAEKSDNSTGSEIHGQKSDDAKDSKEPKKVAEELGSGAKADGRDADVDGPTEQKNEHASEWEDVKKLRSEEGPGRQVGEAGIQKALAEEGARVQTDEQAPGGTGAKPKTAEKLADSRASDTEAGLVREGDVAGTGSGKPEPVPSQPSHQPTAEAAKPTEAELPAEPDAGQRNETEPVVGDGTETGGATGWGEMAMEVAEQQAESESSAVEAAASGWEAARGVSETSGPAVLRSSGQISTRVRPEKMLDQDIPVTLVSLNVLEEPSDHR